MTQPPTPLDRSFYTYASNEATTAFSFDQRKNYKESIIPSMSLPNKYNFWGSEQFYGRVNSKGESIVVLESRLKPLRYTNTSVPAFAINFVADAWRDFIDRVTLENNEGILFKSGPFHNPQALKTWRSPSSAYHQYMLETIYSTFIGSYLPVRSRRGEYVTGVKSFLNSFDNFALECATLGSPLTFSSYITSTQCSVLNTGLSIEISDAAHDQDFQKIKKFIYDGNFDRVVQIASYYGFVLDANAPWRFVADIGSAPMREYMVGVPMEQADFDPRNESGLCDDVVSVDVPRPEAYGFSQIPGFESIVRHAPGYVEYQGLGLLTPTAEVYDRVFSTAYRRTWRNDMDLLKVYMVEFYNTYATAYPQVTIPTHKTLGDYQSECGNVQPKTVLRTTVTRDAFSYVYGDKWGLSTYYSLRLRELGIAQPPKQSTREVSRFLEVYHKTSGNLDHKYEQALKYLQEKIIQPAVVSRLTPKA